MFGVLGLVKGSSLRFKHHSIHHKAHHISELTDSDLFGKMLWQTGGDFKRQIFQRYINGFSCQACFDQCAVTHSQTGNPRILNGLTFVTRHENKLRMILT